MKPMLAGQYVPEKIEKFLPVYGQPKLDGIRVFISGGRAYTRSLKPVRSIVFQVMVRDHADILEGLDGEIIAGDPLAKDAYRRTNSAIMSFDKLDTGVRFHVFDKWDTLDKFEDRISHLKSLTLPDFCDLVPTTLLHTMEEIAAYEAELAAMGHEGVILRNPCSIYKFGRGSPTNCELIKLKQFLDAEARVTGFAEFMHNGNEQTTNALGYAERSSHSGNLVPMGMLGALLAEGKFPDDTPYSVRIGTGFDVALRQEIWNNQDTYRGRLVKFKYFPKGMKEAPRFPVFLGFRDEDDMSPAEEKASPRQGGLFD